MPTPASDSPSLNSDLTLTLTLNHRFFLVWLLIWGVMVWGSYGFFRMVWLGVGIVGCLGFAALALSRLRVMVRDGVLTIAGWNVPLGSWMSAGVDLTQPKEVDLGAPFAPWRSLVVCDTDDQRATLWLWQFKRWGELVRVVARLSLTEGSHAEMSYETEKRLGRFTR